MEEDLFKFLKSEYIPGINPSKKLKEDIKHIQEMDEYFKTFEVAKFVKDLVTKKKIKVTSRLEATLIIEENIDYLTANKKLRYQISYIKPIKSTI